MQSRQTRTDFHALVCTECHQIRLYASCWFAKLNRSDQRNSCNSTWVEVQSVRLSLRMLTEPPFFYYSYIHLSFLFSRVLPNLKECSLSPVTQPSSAWRYIAQPNSTFLPSQPECWLSLSFHLMRSSQHEPSCPCLAPGEVWAPYSHRFLKWCTSFWGLSGKDYISVHNKFDLKT